VTQSTNDRLPSIAVAIIIEDGMVLMVRRRISEGSLLWQFPAGEVETGETAEAAAVREAREETGLVVVPKAMLGERQHPATGRHMVYFACDVVDGEVRVDDEDLDGYEWCDRPKLTANVSGPLFEPVEQYINSYVA
jgi:8-oxo-dGTP diphosphatase